MAEMYGNTWEREHGSTPSPLWKHAIDGLVRQHGSSGAETRIKGAFASLLASPKQWPPSLPEFMSLCRTSSEWGAIAARAPIHRAMLESDEVKAKRKEVGQKRLAEIRRILGGG